MSDAIRVEIAPPCATITLTRERKLNALDADMTDALLLACRQIERARGVRVAIITGEGSRAFCAGGDIAAWSALDARDFATHWVREGHDAFDALARLSVPLIAVLNGHTLGGGLELAAVADYRIAEQHVTLGQPEPSLGIIPGWSGTQRACRRFGTQRVRRMALFGDVYDADTAQRLGLVDEVVPSGDGMAAALALATRVAARGPTATRVTKQLINAAEGEERERVLEAIAGEVAAMSTELQEGLAAFRERRAPNFGHE